MDFCRKQFRNEAIKESLLIKKNIPKIEDILDETIQRFDRLGKLKQRYKQDFEKKIDPDELYKVALKVYFEIDKFLCIRPKDPPKILHTSKTEFKYYSTSKLITIETLQRVILIPGIAHEYGHHVQNIKALWHTNYNIFSEGHARGIEKMIAESYAEKEDNELFLYDITEETQDEIFRAYIWVCNQLGKKPKASLLKWYASSGPPSKYSIGNTFFSIYEKEYGKEIYKKALKCK